MKDEHDAFTAELLKLGGVAASAGAARRPTQRTPFNRLQAVIDEKSFAKVSAKRRCMRTEIDPETGMTLSITDNHERFVPVAFVAKDWDVSTRRIRSLLTAGRLHGRQQANGYWEVRYPYQFIFGTRGPSLKRQARPEKRPRLVVDNTEGKWE